MEFTEYDTRVAAYAIIVDDDERVLLALWNEVEPGEWTLPGGGSDFEETAEQAAVREVYEETGYEVELTRLLGIDSFALPSVQRSVDRPARPLKSVRVVFEARVIGGGLRPEVDGTTDEARWIPLAEVSSLRRVSLVDVALELWRKANA